MRVPLVPAGTGELTYEIRNIVDRVGGGDSFGAGLIFALISRAWKMLRIDDSTRACTPGSDTWIRS